MLHHSTNEDSFSAGKERLPLFLLKGIRIINLRWNETIDCGNSWCELPYLEGLAPFEWEGGLDVKD